ncbi:MAG: hypothetical protein ACU0CO_04450 [Shimia sp.]
MGTPAIVQTFLDRVSDAFVDDDFEAWLGSVTLPLTMVTRSGASHIDTREGLEDEFGYYVGLIGLYDVTRIERRVLSVDPNSPLHLIARYETQLWCGKREVGAPYVSTAMLQFIGGTWRASAILGAIGKRAWAEPIPAEDAASNVVPFKAVRGR